MVNSRLTLILFVFRLNFMRGTVQALLYMSEPLEGTYTEDLSSFSRFYSPHIVNNLVELILSYLVFYYLSIYGVYRNI
jgi:hypothetical protein